MHSIRAESIVFALNVAAFGILALSLFLPPSFSHLKIQGKIVFLLTILSYIFIDCLDK